MPTSTSSLQGLDNTDGGVCRATSMKLVLRVGTEASSTEGRASSTEGGSIGSEVGLFAGVACCIVLLLLVIVVLLMVVWRYHRRHATPDRDVQQSLSLNTLATPKRDSYGGSSEDIRSEPSHAVFPPRPSDSVFCRHHERVSGDYRHPGYMVQEMPPQSPTNIYYKV
ncbi:ephrin-B2-like [Oncorhynchus keta]|uniref:ephrin-B2-like n=1 Tax=Oncorhynchus keta TaxID=8018 RepID=UPI00227D24E7|nr:ephrin-B2-like [Oncorhynchus keta]